MIELRFMTYSNGETNANIEWFEVTIDRGDLHHIPLKNDYIEIGYHLFDMAFYKRNLVEIVPYFKTEKDLEFLNTKYKIPEHKTAYNDKRCKSEHSYTRSLDMGLWYDDSLSPSEKLRYFNEHKEDVRHTCLYECRTEQDIAMAELHYYITHGYKFQRCKMCNKPFYTKTLKNKYCQRIGENPKYPNHSCNKARQLERDEISRNKNKVGKLKKIIYNTLTPLRIGEHIKCREDIKNEYAARYYDEYIKHRTDSQEYAEYVRDKFIVECDEYGKNHTDAEYVTWMYEQYKRYVPNGRKTL